ncbi:hypothetical protein [Mesorhizobium sp. M4B.F.Ca.ET.058.02.1.1]|uniref:hypothetical protein n=1 Tax=Mesorhizobium sp. M4B.F.Ca.ET.058.02.1.1 TaxID=2493675 RepID=UPI000F74E327|nr:hypothetical protein [Mesorhizobium sp. M4B.F.Ca.ET.058.02.1.1]AZO48071.1 hypothetical protein EJ073_09760 [Mesorhizobium sp. M4B.F.Ca.ET.058.02.1.1]
MSDTTIAPLQKHYQESLDYWRKALRELHFEEERLRFQAEVCAGRILRLKRRAYESGVEIK